MEWFLMAFVFAILSVVPLLLKRAFILASIVGLSLFLFGGWLFYVATPHLMYPIFGLLGVLVFVVWIMTTLIAGATLFIEEESRFFKCTLPFGVGAFVVLMTTWTMGWGVFRSDDYKNLIGVMEVREWTQDVQPADPNHIRLVTEEYALFLAEKQLVQVPGAIGSQFDIDRNRIVLQRINGEFWYVIPLDFKSWKVWTSVDGVPAYIKVNGTDPSATPVVVNDLHFRYTPNAYFGHNLERHLRSDGYFFKGLAEYMLEVDDDGRAWWVVPVFETTIGWSGKVMTGVIQVDPETGSHSFFSKDDIPIWIDRAIPKSFVTQYISYWGDLKGGWWNSFWGGKDLVEPEYPSLVYGADGEPYFVTGITSTNDGDKSVVGFIYTNSRTGVSVQYHAVGGTDEAVLEAVNNKVNYRKWHGSSPTLYNLYGVMTSVVPILGEAHTYQGVALVKMGTTLETVVGEDLESALREYQKLLAGSGNSVALEKAHGSSEITSEVLRVSLRK